MNEENDFNLESDENGLFDYTTSNGDEIKFRFFTNNDEEVLRNVITSQITDTNIQKAEDVIKDSVDYIFEKINEK